YFDRVRAQWARLADFFRTEGAVAVFSTDDRGEGGVVFAESNNDWEGGHPAGVPWVVLAPEDYNRVARLLDHKVPARAQVELQATFDDANQDGFDVIAEIPGGKKKDELVMLGAHLDSWHAGTGASDNGAGSAVV